MRIIPTLLAATALIATAAPAQRLDRIAQRDNATGGGLAMSIVEGLTTEVGQRLAGTEAEARARTWAVRRLKGLGFTNVHVEPFDMPVWVRGAETAEVLQPYPQKLMLTALGNSGATPQKGIEAQVVGYPSLEALRAAPAEEIKGKIVFVWHRMAAAQDGSSYGYFGGIRRIGPSIASQKGAAAILIRSIGTDHHRVPHTGVQNWVDGAKPIPAAALSVPDAEQVERMLESGKPVFLRLILTPRQTGIHQSGNVIAEVPGRDKTLPIVLIGGHLDSWDLGTGAIDDAAGVAITASAAKRLLDGPRPLRTVRLVWFGAEEEGGFGGEAYAKAHADEKHELVAEADFGGDKVWRFETNLDKAQAPLVDKLAAALAPYGISRGSGRAHGGTDVAPTAHAQNTAVIDLDQDGTRYFDIHHTADDTLDKVQLDQITQAAEAWSTMLAIVANEPGPMAPAKPAGE